MARILAWRSRRSIGSTSSFGSPPATVSSRAASPR
jgi:hypothetical protein